MHHGASPNTTNVVSERFIMICYMLKRILSSKFKSHISCKGKAPIADLFFCVCVLQRGETALHMAARAGQADVVRYLLKNGAKVETKSKVRTTGATISHCEKQKEQTNSGNRCPLLRRTTRQRCISQVGWEKSTSSSSCCSAAPLLTPPPPQATPPFIWLPVKDTKMLLSCCWKTVPPFPPQPRWVKRRAAFLDTFYHNQNTET